MRSLLVSLTVTGLAATGVVVVLAAMPRSTTMARQQHHAQASTSLSFGARLTGRDQNPPVQTETAGRFRIDFNENLTKAKFRLHVSNGVRVTEAHIHCGREGAKGNVVLHLTGLHEPGWDVHGRWIDNAVVTDENLMAVTCGTTLAELAAAMAAGGLYVDVHTAAHPFGEIRGQLMLIPDSDHIGIGGAQRVHDDDEDDDSDEDDDDEEGADD
ncbi:MAG: CHRD domain-containing protein [Planctomycetota bacterium]|jgi:hypothetical protein